MQKEERLIVLLRHGIAEEQTPDKPDSDRELTDEGHRRMKSIARALAKLMPKTEAIVSSPYLRARQTAEWVARAYKGRVQVREAEALLPAADPDGFADLLDRLDARRAIFVGHEPSISAIMLALTKMRGEVELKKGGCYGIHIAGQARLEWMLPPRVLRRL